MMSKHLFFASLCWFASVFVVSGADQSGFISLDCGLQPENSSYTEPMTGIKYVSDSSYIDVGISKFIAPEYTTNMMQNMWYVRSFPDGTRNCYNLAVNSSNKYLIRASFMYGNYDSENQIPEFDLHLGPNKWDTVKLDSDTENKTKEIIHYVSSNSVQVCLVNTGHGTPFISALELRLLKNSSYVTQSGSLMLFTRLDFGSVTNRTIRYEDDVYDRIWLPYNIDGSAQLSTSLTLGSNNRGSVLPPSIVLSTADTPANASGSLDFSWLPDNETLQFYVYLYFAEVQVPKDNQLREVEIYLNGENFAGPFVLDYLEVLFAYTSSPLRLRSSYQFSIRKTTNSTLPPIINAIEVFSVNELPQPPTDQNDIAAIMNIKSIYRVKRNWQGDPCGPQAFMWDGITCSYGSVPPRIISLNLSSSGLNGYIDPDISQLTQLQSLDLSNNNLTGPVPNFLSQLQFLKILNLANNQLRGSIPAELLERSKTSLLSLSVGGNPGLCSVNSCEKILQKKKSANFVVPLVASVAAFCVLVAISAVIFCILKRKKRRGSSLQQKVNGSIGPSLQRRDTGSIGPSLQRRDTASMRSSLQQVETGRTDTALNETAHDSFDLEPTNRKFTYTEIANITNGFEKALGRGGLGKIYHGYLEGKEVAVKMLSPSSSQGYKQLKAEVKHLFRIHHRNLTPLLGYCNDGEKYALIYEYMPNGHLKQHLSENTGTIFSWEDRLRIVLDVAQGLEYLHNGCKPPIIHRNVKCTNIFLDENFHAKLGGFGLSRAFAADEGNQAYTLVAGTPGYVDPEYYTSNIITEKSDVYSFGVVLLEIITGKPAIIKTPGRVHISQWVESLVAGEDLESILDPKLGGDYDVNSAWKAIEVAMASVSQAGNARPAMSQVVTELKESLAAEVTRKEGLQVQSRDSFESITIGFGNDPIPRLR